MITVMNDSDGKPFYTGAYGSQLLLDCHGCNPDTFTRKNIEVFMKALCKKMDMQAEDFHFWDDLDVPDEERQTEPHAKGTSLCGVFKKKIGVQFIITSAIVIHTLDMLGRCYIDVFSCKDYDQADVRTLVYEYFNPDMIGSHTVIRN